MKAVIKYMMIISVMVAYIFGTAGFTLSHCCCSKTFKTTSSLLNAYTHNSQKAYFNHTDEAVDLEGVQTIKQRKCCGDSVYSMDGVNYSNEDNLQAPAVCLVEILALLPHPDDICSFSSSLVIDTICDISHFWLRRGATPDLLCTFLC